MGKMIIIDEHERRDMTFEEVLVKYRPLVMSEIYSFNNLKLEFDDKYQEASIGLWNAYMKYDADTTIGFGVLAKLAIKQKLNRVIQYNNYAKRRGMDVISIDRTMMDKRDVERSIMDTLESDENIEESLILKHVLIEFMSKISSLQRKTLDLYGKGYNLKDISILLESKPQTVSMRMTTIKKIFNDCKNE